MYRLNEMRCNNPSCYRRNGVVEWRAVIARKRYDTGTAEEVSYRGNGLNRGDFQWRVEHIYRTPRGAWFLFGEGGAMSPYAESLPGSGGGRIEGNAIEVLTADRAAELLEQWGDMDSLDEYFADFVEDA